MTLDERVNHLEAALGRANRRFQALLAAILVVVAVAALGLPLGIRSATAETASDEKREVVRARSFIVEDENGVNRALLGSNGQTTGLFLQNEKGEIRSALTSGADGATLAMFDDQGKNRATLKLLANGAPTLMFLDGNGEKRMLLTLNAAGDPGIGLLDHQEQTRVGITLMGHGRPYMVFKDKDRNERLQIGISKENEPEFAMYDTRGKGRLSFNVLSDVPMVSLGDSESRLRALLALDPVEGPSLKLYDEKEDPIFSAPTAKDH